MQNTSISCALCDLKCSCVNLKAAVNSALAPLLDVMNFSFLKTRQLIQPSVGSELFFHTL